MATLLFKSLPDRGYTFAKPLGLLLITYLAWLLAMLGLAPFASSTLVTAAFTALGLGIWMGGGFRVLWVRLGSTLAHRWPTILLSEVVFLGAMLLAIWIRAHDPTPWGTERPMDFAFFNAVQRSSTFPPGDPWLAGYSINYYYFGYVMMGAMALLSGVTASTGYNLALALIFALTAQGVFGLIANLILLVQATDCQQPEPPRCTTPWLFPLLGVLFVLLAANQSGAVQVALGDERTVALDSGQLISALSQAAGGARTITLNRPVVTSDVGSFSSWERKDNVTTFNWWWPSRSLWDEYPVADPSRPEVTAERRHTITEFPLFSFRLGDMHPHLMALPFGLLAAALALATLTRSTIPAPGSERFVRMELAFAGLILGSLYTINSWDMPTYVLLYGTALAILILRLDTLRPWLMLAKLLTFVIAMAYLLFLPFHLTFRSLVGRAEPWLDLPLISRLTSMLGVYGARRTELQTFLIIFGLFALPIVTFVYLAQPKGTRQFVTHRSNSFHFWGSRLPYFWWLPPALLLLGLLTGFPLLALVGLGLLALERACRLRKRPGECFALLLAALGCAVLFGTELVYIRDVFESFSARLNTVFKFYYQIWLLWGLLAPFALWWCLRQASGIRRAVVFGVTGLSLVLLAGALVYPWLTLGELGRGTVHGLDSRTPRELSPAGAASIAWLRTNVPDNSVVLEAVAVGNAAEVVTQGVVPQCSGSYDYALPDFPNTGSYGFGGVSAATGLPTLLGWHGHQVQWRGGDPQALAQLAPRCVAVDTIYRSTDVGKVQALLQEYEVRFVYVGALEQQLYSVESLAKFAQLGEPVFNQNEVTIYRLR